MLREWMERALASVSKVADAHAATDGNTEPTTPPRVESRAIDGIRVDVINTRADVDTERVFARAQAVIQRVREYQPWRLAHIRRDLAGIVVQRYACRGAYFPDSRLCMLELTFMANEQFSDSQVAACLIHEGMHARLDQLSAKYGVTPFAEARARHERICRRAELDFGLAVPDGAPVVQRARESLMLADDEVAPRIEWGEAARRIAAVDAHASRAPSDG
jgi:hypothetical protein